MDTLYNQHERADSFTLTCETIADVSSFAPAFVASRFVETERVLVTLINSNVAFVNVDAS